MFTIQLHKNILCIFVHDISQYLMKYCISMSDISQLMFQVSLHHYLTARASPASSSESESEPEQPLPTGSIVGHASSGQFLGSLLSDHSAQRMVRRFPTRSWIFDHCASTLVLCGHFPRKEVLCFAGTFLLICFRQEEMTSDRPRAVR